MAKKRQPKVDPLEELRREKVQLEARLANVAWAEALMERVREVAESAADDVVGDLTVGCW